MTGPTKNESSRGVLHGDFSPLHVHGEISNSDVPIEFVKRAFPNLEAAEKLNSLTLEGEWPSSYHRGQVVLWLTFHAVELFLKGVILKLAPGSKINGHSLAELIKVLDGLLPDHDFDPPFRVEAVPPCRDFIKKAESEEKRIHEMLRYPVDIRGEPWPGVRGFSASLFRKELVGIRADLERLYSRVFLETAGS